MVAASRNMDESSARFTWSRRILFTEYLGPGPDPAPPGPGHEPHADVGVGEARILGHDDDVAEERDGGAQPGAVPVDGGDYGHIHLQKVHDEPAHLEERGGRAGWA